MARTFEPLARRLSKALHDLAAGKPGKPVSIAQAAKQINVSDQSLIEGAINHAAHMGWLTVDGNPIHSLQLTEAGQRAALRKK